uniref:Uncharacterized protein n=1 Tax=Brassica oleracea TaxID=3712 RepID=A0A3P6AJZ8_BRAOL|nr:unnamed protein product [Brassica oleracea]
MPKTFFFRLITSTLTAFSLRIFPRTHSMFSTIAEEQSRIL